MFLFWDFFSFKMFVLLRHQVNIDMSLVFGLEVKAGNTASKIICAFIDIFFLEIYNLIKIVSITDFIRMRKKMFFSFIFSFKKSNILTIGHFKVKEKSNSAKYKLT